MLAHRYRLPVALIVTALAAGAATFLLRPRAGIVEAAPASAGDYFTPAQLERAKDFRGPQRALFVATLVLEGAVLVLLVVRPPRAVRRALRRAGTRPLRGGAATGAAFAVGATLLTLPLSALAHERSRDVGLATQTWLPWLGDVAKAAGVGALLTGAGATIALALVRRFPRHWWVPGSAAIVALSAVLVFASPVVIDPLFNDFEPLPQGRLRSDVLELAKRADVDVGQVYRVDASRQTTAGNAYVWGLGRTKRVVIYDNLIRGFPDDQVRSVVAHELSHVVGRDVPRGLLWLAIVAPAGTFLVKVLAERFSRGAPLALPSGLPALALAVALVTTGLGWASNTLSRRVEARADTYALELTRDPAAFIGLTRSLAISNVGDPSPPWIFRRLWGTHPTTLERIGAGLQWAADQPSTGGRGR